MIVMDVQSRFAALLNPIRDLTKNWAVDVAGELEEYLREVCEEVKGSDKGGRPDHVKRKAPILRIAGITISFDGGCTKMNFAEAALLIQGSACVYSKKVEYLYALVYQTLDLIASNKKLAQASSVDAQGRDIDVSMLNRGDEEIGMITRTPMSLVPLQDSERVASTPLLSRTGELLGSKVDFKMNTGSLHSSGAIILEPMSSILETQPRASELIPGHSLSLTEDQPVSAAPAMDTSDVAEPGEWCGGHDTPSPLPSASPNLSPSMSKRASLRKNHVRVVNIDNRRNPWRPLDPHIRVSQEHRPFKKGNTSRMPASLKTTQTRKRKRKEEGGKEDRRKNQPLEPLAQCLLKSFYSCSSVFPKNHLKAPLSSEFEDLYWTEQRARMKQRARDTRKLRQLHCDMLESLQPGAEEAVDSYQPLGQAEEGGAQTTDAVLADGLPGAAAGDDSFEGVEPMALDDGELSSDMAFDRPVVHSFEDLVRNYVESTLANAVAYAEQTDLSRRVTQWEERIKPTLTKKEQQSVFDIHQCGTQVLRAFQEAGCDNLSFDDIVQNKEEFEICRLFTASLQLANDRNLEIFKAEGSEITMRLKLLSINRHFETMSHYRAPSLYHH